METLKKRADFLRVKAGPKWVTPSFILQAHLRPCSRDVIASSDLDHKGKRKQDLSASPRFGFIITKRIGIAVTRNRIRRRLKEALKCIEYEYAKPDHDYVLIARQGADKRDFGDLIDDLQTAFQRVNKKSS